jgi:hypothetical protein
MSAIQKDAETVDTGLNADSASELFLKQWKVAPEGEPAKPAEGDKKTPEPVDSEDTSDDEDILLEDEEDSEDPKESDQQPKDKKLVEDDEALVKVTVDGQELEVSIKDLKRLAGQEASLTRKSMELAARRKEAEEVGTYHAQGLARLVQMAEEEYAPYAGIDFNIAAKDLSTEEYKALREEAQAKYEKYQYLTQELTQYQQKFTEHKAALMQEQAAQTIAELSDPEKGIKGWGPKLYEEIGAYAVSKGMKPETFANILDAPSLRILHDAYRLDKAKALATKKKAVAPQKVLKSTATPDSQRFSDDKSKAALSKLRQTGSRDDAVSAILSKWGVS